VGRLTAEELRECRRLHVRLGRRVDSVFSGDLRSAVRGRGMEFEEVRGYVPGDDVRHIDWNVTARTGEPFIKVFREERQNTIVLAVDVSGSTRVGSGGRDGRTDRRRQIARIAGGLAFAGIRNRDRVGLVTFSDRIERYLAPRPTSGHAWAVIQEVFGAQAAARGTDLAGALGFVSRMQRKRSVIVLISDFLDDGPWGAVLATLARRHEVHGIVVHDPLDLGVSGLGLVELVDSETGETFVTDGAAWAAENGVEARVRALERCGVRAVAIGTGDDADIALHRHFQKVRRK
jgi:uncharacterized protein (DUF58 family)